MHHILIVGTITCSGSLCDAMVVNPTMSEKKIETESKLSGGTESPVFNLLATCLQINAYLILLTSSLQGLKCLIS